MLAAHWANPENKLGGVELIVVVKEVLGVQELRKLTNFSGRIFVDEASSQGAEKALPGQGLFKAMGAAVMGKEGFENKKVHVHGARAKAAGWEGDMAGEGTQLGGMIVGSGGAAEYIYVEQEWGDHAVHDPESWGAALQILQKLAAVDEGVPPAAATAGSTTTTTTTTVTVVSGSTTTTTTTTVTKA